MEKTAHPTYAHCPIRHIVDRFGDKWSLLVLYNLHTSGCLRFSMSVRGGLSYSTYNTSPLRYSPSGW